MVASVSSSSRIRNDNFFNRGAYYGQNDDVMRFAFFCRAALEFMLKTNKHPDVIHCHDWQTALVPVMLYEMYQHLGMRHSRVCFTVHNFRHQGVTGAQILQATGLEPARNISSTTTGCATTTMHARSTLMKARDRLFELHDHGFAAPRVGGQGRRAGRTVSNPRCTRITTNLAAC